MSRHRFVVALLLGATVVCGCKTSAKPSASGPTSPSDLVAAASWQAAIAPATESTAPVETSSPIDSAPPVPTSSSPSPTASEPSSPSVSASGTPSGADPAGRTPCPLPPPEVFVHVSKVALVGGDVVVTYRIAARLCGGEDDGAYETTGIVDKQARVDPAAKILMVPADIATSSAEQITTAEFPSAMATPTFQYFGVTFGPTGAMVSMEQFFHP